MDGSFGVLSSFTVFVFICTVQLALAAPDNQSGSLYEPDICHLKDLSD